MTNKKYLRRSKMWNFTDKWKTTIIACCLVFGTSISLLSSLLFCSHVLLAIAVLSFGCILILMTFPVMTSSPVWFPPQSGYILYDNTEDAKDRDFDKLINHYGYEDDKIYCVLKCDHNVIFYYDKKRKQIYRKDIDSFINGGWFIQIGYDEKLAEYGKSLDYFKLSKMINDRLEGKSSSIMEVYE